MKSKVRMEFEPSDAEKLILANQACMMTALAELLECSGERGKVLAKAYTAIVKNTHDYLESFKKNGIQ